MLDVLYDPPKRRETKSFKWIIVDSAIIAGIAFMATLPADRLPSLLDLYIALRAFFYALLLQLAVERGLKPRIKTRNINK